MKEPKTIRGYISLIRKIERISPTSLKGFDSLPDEHKEIIMLLDADISNNINEIKARCKPG